MARITVDTRALAAEFIQRVQAKTPVGDYPDTISFTTRDGKAVSFKYRRIKPRLS